MVEVELGQVVGGGQGACSLLQEGWWVTAGVQEVEEGAWLLLLLLHVVEVVLMWLLRVVEEEVVEGKGLLQLVLMMLEEEVGVLLPRKRMRHRASHDEGLEGRG